MYYCISGQAGEAQKQAYPTTHSIENASIMAQIIAGSCGFNDISLIRRQQEDFNNLYQEVAEG